MLEHNNYRNWITHLKPRLVLVDGISIRDQIVGNSIMSHEVCVVAMRRLGQIDKANNKEEAGMCWRKFMDPDFAVSSSGKTLRLCIPSFPRI
jgi:hypothetical protein